MRQPLYKAELQSPLNAKGFPITNIPSENLKQVWISNVARTDNSTGTGTRTDPYDGSTQPLLDAVFKSYYDSSTTDIVFYLSPGTFSLKGSWDNDWAMLSGWHIKGAGKTLTRVVQVAGTAGVSAGTNGALFGAGAMQVYDNQSVEDLWCDCAWFRSGPDGDNSRPHGNFRGVELYGTDAVIRNVRVSGFGWADGVCPAMAIIGGANDIHIPHNALIAYCEAFTEGHLNSIGCAMRNLAAASDDAAPIFAQNGQIIGNWFQMPTAGSGCGVPEGFDSGVVRSNRITALFIGIFQNQSQQRGIHISENRIAALDVGGFAIKFGTPVGIPAAIASSSLFFTDNVCLSASGIALLESVSNSIIARNRISLGSGANNISSIDLEGVRVTNIAVLDNVIDIGIPYVNTAGSGCWFKGNRTPAGAIQIQDTGDNVPTTLFVSQAFGNAATAVRLSPTRPFLTINAAIAAASSGDTIDVMDGTFNERLNAKDGVTVRFRPQAKLVSTTDASGGCIISTAIDQTFTVYHEHAPMVCSGDNTRGIFINHAGCTFNIHGDISAVGGANQTGVSVAAVSTLNIWGGVHSVDMSAILCTDAASIIVIDGTITCDNDYAVSGTAGTLRFYGCLISGKGAAGAVSIAAASSQHVYVDCSIVSLAGAGHAAIRFANVGSLKPVFRNCLLSPDFGAAESMLANAVQGVRLYGDVHCGWGANPPTNVTFEGPGTFTVGVPIVIV